MFHTLNNLSHFSHATDQLIIFLSVYLAYFLLTVLVVWIIFFQKTLLLKLRILLECVMTGMLGVGILVQGIRLFFHHLRPAYNIYGIYPLFEEVSFSFPSAHSTFYFGISYIVYIHNKSLGVFFFLASFIVGIARVMAGVHFPFDILAGAGLGILTSIFVHHYVNKFIFEKR